MQSGGGVVRCVRERGERGSGVLGFVHVHVFMCVCVYVYMHVQYVYCAQYTNMHTNSPLSTSTHYTSHTHSCQRQASAGGMRAQLATYRELRDNMSEGARFYTALQEAVKNLAQQAGDYCLTRRIQRCVGVCFGGGGLWGMWCVGCRCCSACMYRWLVGYVSVHN